MPPSVSILQAQDYNQAYFDGGQHPHLAGYTSYKRNPIDYADEDDINKKEYFRREAKIIFDRFHLSGLRVLDLGCAKGFHLKDLNDFGAIATGVDWSTYAVAHAEPQVAGKIVIADLRTYVHSLPNNSFDYVIGLRLLPCLPTISLQQFITDVKRIAPRAYFTIDSKNTNSQFYNVQNPQVWQGLINSPNIIVEEFQSTEHQ